MKGRKPKLVRLPGFEKVSKRKAKPRATVPGPFDPTAKLDDVAQAEWDRIRRVAYWIESPSAATLTELCRIYSEIQAATDFIAKHGPMLTNKDGDFIRNPALVTLEKARATFIRLSGELGLTSCSQTKVVAPQSTGMDLLEANLCG